MSLKAQTHFNTIRNVWVISPHWLVHPHLILPNASHAYAAALPSRSDSNTTPHLHPHHSLHFHPPLPSLCLRGAPQHASDTASHPYACVVPSQHCLPSLRLECPPDMLPTPLILTLV
ncbi:hypothetical protein O181_127393 [Austropuccinia psidii MF-1]|uniref:Uncharacterized protein n=1 Tax=Austropuccinia psidii MF-1 TaxID=1389203 RepID=A0A9Q3KUC7_9BASI|nr:hypothetical protein [Austropuccinia psidii MF-1]